MRTSRIAATFVASTLVALVLTSGKLTSLEAADPAPPQRGGTPSFPNGIAVIDVTFILENYEKMKQSKAAFNRSVEDEGKKFKAAGDELTRGMEQLKGLKPSSKEFKDLEERLAKAQSDLKIKVSLMEKDFAEREAKSYLAAYRELEAAVKAYSEAYNISLVLRFNGTPVDQNNQNAVRAEMFKNVMYFDKSINITDTILQALNRTYAGASAQRPPAGQPQQPPANKQR